MCKSVGMCWRLAAMMQRGVMQSIYVGSMVCCMWGVNYSSQDTFTSSAIRENMRKAVPCVATFKGMVRHKI